MSENQEQINDKEGQQNINGTNSRNEDSVHSQEKADDYERSEEKNDRNEKSQQEDQNSEDFKKSSNRQEANSNEEESNENDDEENERSSSPDDNKSEDDEEDSNLKSDNKDDEEGRSDEDLKKEEPSGKKCFNRLCNSKKIYKKLRSKVEHAKYRFFCRQCYESYYNNDFCEFCEQIYSSTANSDDDDQWIGCDSCSRWNHIECEKKFRNKDINEIKDEDTQYLCLTCSYKPKEKNGHDIRQPKGKKEISHEDHKHSKQNIEISRDQRVQIFSKKIETLPSLEYFLQNYSIFFYYEDFRLWINENLIKDDLEVLREASRRNQEENRKNKKVKIE